MNPRKPPVPRSTRAARDLGNIEAAEKGPEAYGRRVVRQKVCWRANGALGRFLRGIGLK